MDGEYIRQCLEKNLATYENLCFLIEYLHKNPHCKEKERINSFIDSHMEREERDLIELNLKLEEEKC